MKMSRFAAEMMMDPEYITGSLPASQGIPSQSIPGVPDTVDKILALANPMPMAPSAPSKLPMFLIGGAVLAFLFLRK